MSGFIAQSWSFSSVTEAPPSCFSCSALSFLFSCLHFFWSFSLIFIFIPTHSPILGLRLWRLEKDTQIVTNSQKVTIPQKMTVSQKMTNSDMASEPRNVTDTHMVILIATDPRKTTHSHTVTSPQRATYSQMVTNSHTVTNTLKATALSAINLVTKQIETRTIPSVSVVVPTVNY